MDGKKKHEPTVAEQIRIQNILLLRQTRILEFLAFGPDPDKRRIELMKEDGLWHWSCEYQSLEKALASGFENPTEGLIDEIKNNPSEQHR